MTNLQKTRENIQYMVDLTNKNAGVTSRSGMDFSKLSDEEFNALYDKVVGQ
jgi:hypothetical protein